MNSCPCIKSVISIYSSAISPIPEVTPRKSNMEKLNSLIFTIVRKHGITDNVISIDTIYLKYVCTGLFVPLFINDFPFIHNRKILYQHTAYADISDTETSAVTLSPASRKSLLQTEQLSVQQLLSSSRTFDLA